MVLSFLCVVFLWDFFFSFGVLCHGKKLCNRLGLRRLSILRRGFDDGGAKVFDGDL